MATELLRFLDTDGDGTGTKEAAADFSGESTASIFIKPAAGTKYIINSLEIYVEDGADIAMDKWGADLTLTNGLVIKKSNATADILDLTDGLAIKTTAHILQVADKVSVSEATSGDRYLKAVMSLGSIVLDGDKAEKLEIVLDDNFAALVSQKFFVRGLSMAVDSGREGIPINDIYNIATT